MEPLSDQGSPSEPTDLLNPHVVAVATDPLALVAFYSKRRDVLIEELAMVRTLLDQLWKVVPYDKSILKEPYKGDIAVTCRSCGVPTKWRSGTGAAQHVECPPEKRAPRSNTLKITDLPLEVLAMLSGSNDEVIAKGETEESLDDD